MDTNQITAILVAIPPILLAIATVIKALRETEPTPDHDNLANYPH